MTTDSPERRRILNPLAFNQRVVGSIPTGLTNQIKGLTLSRKFYIGGRREMAHDVVPLRHALDAEGEYRRHHRRTIARPRP
jgi:hypothetical protein